MKIRTYDPSTREKFTKKYKEGTSFENAIVDIVTVSQGGKVGKDYCFDICLNGKRIFPNNIPTLLEEGMDILVTPHYQDE